MSRIPSDLVRLLSLMQPCQLHQCCCSDDNACIHKHTHCLASGTKCRVAWACGFLTVGLGASEGGGRIEAATGLPAE